MRCSPRCPREYLTYCTLSRPEFRTAPPALSRAPAVVLFLLSRLLLFSYSTFPPYYSSWTVAPFLLDSSCTDPRDRIEPSSPLFPQCQSRAQCSSSSHSDECRTCLRP